MEQTKKNEKVKGLVERLRDGDNIVIGEGYLWEFERRGYLKSGGFVPEVVLEFPEVVKSCHREYVHAGSDVVEAFTYYGHREKLRQIGREEDLEPLNRGALKIAREIADETGTLMAGDICFTGIYSTDDKESHQKCRDMFVEQTQWAVAEGCDYIIAETFNYLGEALIALDAIKKHGKGVPAVVTLTAFGPDITLDGFPFPDACRKLEQAGAAVVGLNCTRGPTGMLPLIREIRKVCVGPLAALPVPFRTNEKCKTYFAFKDDITGEPQYPVNIECHICNRSDVKKFAIEAKEIGVQYIGLCCGNSSNMLREIAEVYGRKPPGCKYSPDVSLNIIVGEASENISKESAKVRKFSMGDISSSELDKLKMDALRIDEHHNEDHDGE